MDINAREALKAKIDADLVLLIAEIINMIFHELEKVLSDLRTVRLEGYDN